MAATTGSSLSDLERAAGELDPAMPITVVRSWPDQPDYVAALAERVRRLMDDGALTARLGARAARGMDRYALKSVLPAVMDLYLSALEG